MDSHTLSKYLFKWIGPKLEFQPPLIPKRRECLIYHDRAAAAAAGFGLAECSSSSRPCSFYLFIFLNFRYWEAWTICGSDGNETCGYYLCNAIFEELILNREIFYLSIFIKLSDNQMKNIKYRDWRSNTSPFLTLERLISTL